MLSDGDKLNTLSKASMEDVGTRMEHLTELYELWKTGLDILERYDKSGPFYERKKEELEDALRLLGFHMQKDYHEDAIRKEIDNNTEGSKSEER